MRAGQLEGEHDTGDEQDVRSAHDGGGRRREEWRDEGRAAG